jgi:predicted acylesterase/phospholipase RssA
MDPPNITLSSDIHILFNSNTDQSDSERVLRENGVTTIEQFLKLTTSDLLIIGISDVEAEALFNKAKQLVSQPKNPQAAFRDVRSWLKAYNLEQLEPNFANIDLTMLPYIRRSDLINALKIPIFDPEHTLNRVWEALKELELKLPPPVTSDDDSCELICTTTQSPITVDLNEANFVRMLSEADTKESSIKVSFVGDTGAGKSLIISQLLSFDDRIRRARGPLVAIPGQLESTTGNVCVYSTISNDEKYKFMLLDFEGAYGGLPRRLLSRFTLLTGTLFSGNSANNTHVTELTKERHEVVKTIFPQLAYVISNIVVLIDKQPPHHTGYIEKLTKFAELSTKNSGSGEKPFLIVVQNFANPETQRDSTTSYTLNQSTSDFMQCLSREKKAQELLQHYREICFIRLPSWALHPLLFDQQICLLQNRLAYYAEILKKDSWFSKNFWNDQFWFAFLKMLCNEFKHSSEVNIPQLIASIVQPQLTPIHRIMNFWRLIWTPPIVGKEKDRTSVETQWMYCFRISIERLADLMFDELRTSDMDHALVRNTLMTSVEEFTREIWRYFPCLHQFKDGIVCGIAKSLHTTGHYGQKTGDHEGMEPPTNVLNLIVQRFKELKDIDSSSRAKRSLDITQKGLQRLAASDRQKLRAKWIPFCMLCLRSFSQEHIVFSMKCSHVFCDKCARLANELTCPIHNTLFSYIDYRKKIPNRAFPRVLSLDGGGVRGIVQIRILEQIEKMTGYKIHQLFDLVVGSGIGGLVALLVALTKHSVSYYTDLFLEYPQRIFKGDVFVKLGFWSKFKYKSKFLQMLAEELFGDMSMASACGNDQTLVAVTAYRKTALKWGPVFFANYVHGAGLEETTDFSGRRIIHNCRVSEVATVTSSTPPFFRPHLVGDDEYIEGSIVANNPSMYALKEAVFVWKRAADCLVSVGTGFYEKTPAKIGDTKLIWAKRNVELVHETLETHDKTVKTCIKHGIFYARLNLETNMTYRTDDVTKQELEKLSNETLQYLVTSSDQVKSVCLRLLASLLYVAEIQEQSRDANNETSLKIAIHSRQLPFRIATLLGGPNWQLICIPLKGNFAWKVDYIANGTENPLAIIHLDHVKPDYQLGIDMGVGESTYQISGCGRITLTPPYVLSARGQNNNLMASQSASTVSKLIFSTQNLSIEK